MSAEDREAIVEKLARAFGRVEDVTPAESAPLNILFHKLELPDPWRPSSTRALAIFANWPSERPLFFVAEDVAGEGGEPPQSNHTAFYVGESWRGFSFSFTWSGDDPVRAIQLWMSRFLNRS